MSQLFADGNPDAERLKIGDAQVDVPEWFITYLRAALSQTFRTVPDVFVSWMVDKNALYGLGVPIGQVIGAVQELPQLSTGTNSFSGTLAGGANTSASGPSVTGLPAGSYLLLAGYTGIGDSTVVTIQWDIKPAGVTLFSVSGSETSSPGISCAAFGTATFADVTDISSTYTVTNGAGTNRNWSMANMQIIAIKTANP